MKHHRYHPGFAFAREPVEFSKDSERDLLQYCLGATLYMPATKSIADAIIRGRLPGLTSMVMCFEDAICESALPEAEATATAFLEELLAALRSGRLAPGGIPLIFLRVREQSQFEGITRRLSADQLDMITGFVFPKFARANGRPYLAHLESLNRDRGRRLYGMPILESSELAFKETRTDELMGLVELLRPCRELILNVRVGAADFSSKFGVRRGIDYTIYDILTVRDCLSDILNFLGREGSDYVISAPVWEYFMLDRSLVFQGAFEDGIHGSLLKRDPIVNKAIDGLLREVVLDKANGFVGKTIIHPTHLEYVNALQAVTREEYQDAVQLLATEGGVVKSASRNKMNEANPHRNWAKKIHGRALAYGVIEDDTAYYRLFSPGETAA